MIKENKKTLSRTVLIANGYIPRKNADPSKMMHRALSLLTSQFDPDDRLCIVTMPRERKDEGKTLIHVQVIE